MTRTIRIEVREDIFLKVFDFLKLLPKKSVKVEVEEPDDIFTKNDEKTYNQSIRELRDGEAIDLKQAKKELLGV